MSNAIIKVEQVGKRFIIGHQKQEHYSTLRDVVTENIRTVWHKTKELMSGNVITEGELEEEFWALRDVSFDIKQGDRVGIIGRNGAGKSTLLKILSRITEPTTGRISIKGRVASLLEVGTGFHPELSGRENIYLNGAILGMSRTEIKKKFDEIVAFAEVEKFLDTPVKRYSSGMYVRLAFAVAAHLEPEILIVDEVLAVGDAQFQKKCLGKMEDVSQNEGRTVLFVSHNMGAIRKLCHTGIFLTKGMLAAYDNIDNIVDIYMKDGAILQEHKSFENYKEKRSGSAEIVFKWAKLLDERGNARSEFFIGDTLELEFSIYNPGLLKTGAIAIHVKGLDDVPLLHMMNQDSNFPLAFNRSTETYKVSLQNLSLFPGDYAITLTVADPGGHLIYDNLESCIGFTVLEGGPKVNRRLPKEAGLFFVTPAWKKIE